MTDLTLEDFLPYRLARAGTVISQQFRTIYAQRYDLTIPEWRVLATLGQFGTMRAKAIGAHSYLHKTKVSRAVRALEERRWLSRRQSAEDRREEDLSLTAAGLRAYGEIIPLAKTFEASLLAALGTEAGPFMAALAKLEAKALQR